MAGVGVLSSLAVFLLLLLASFSAAREERSRKRAWVVVPEADVAKYKYLALLQYGTDEAPVYCPGSIISPSAVLTYCQGDPKMAFAGLNKDGSVLKPGKQKKTVTDVKDCPKYENLKICKVENWDFGDDVGAIELPSNEESVPADKACQVLGYDKTKGAHMLDKQTIGDRNKCAISISGDVPDKKDHWYSAAVADEKLADADQGGPVVCGPEVKLRGINVGLVTGSDGTNDVDCNTYINIAHYSKWIEEQINAADSGASGGTGGNSTSPSSGYSIHSYLNKYSNWKVLGFLVPTIVTFLQY